MVDDGAIKDLYERLNKTDSKMSELIGLVSATVKQNDELIGLLKKSQTRFFVICLILLATLAYGAIGKEGLYAVRSTVALVDVVPWHNDFDKLPIVIETV